MSTGTRFQDERMRILGFAKHMSYTYVEEALLIVCLYNDV